MDIPSISVAMNQNSLSTAVSVALTKKVMDNTKDSAQALINSMTTSVNPNLGTNLDVRA